MVPDSSSDIISPLPALVDIPEPEPGPESEEFAFPAEPVPRQIYIRSEELSKYGYTKGCPRCEALRAKQKTTLNHSDSCRKRIEEAMQADESEETERRSVSYTHLTLPTICSV